MQRLILFRANSVRLVIKWLQVLLFPSFPPFVWKNGYFSFEFLFADDSSRIILNPGFRSTPPRATNMPPLTRLDYFSSRILVKKRWWIPEILSAAFFTFAFTCPEPVEGSFILCVTTRFSSVSLFSLRGETGKGLGLISPEVPSILIHFWVLWGWWSHHRIRSGRWWTSENLRWKPSWSRQIPPRLSGWGVQARWPEQISRVYWQSGEHQK